MASEDTAKQDVTTGAPDKEPRTFTQEEVDKLIGERLFREREKYADFETYKEKAAKYDAAEEASKKEWQRSKSCERQRAKDFGHRNRT